MEEESVTEEENFIFLFINPKSGSKEGNKYLKLNIESCNFRIDGKGV